MNALKVQVKNGRLSFDVPTELPEGTIVELSPKTVEPKKQLLWEEIKVLYPDEWVALVDLLFNDDRAPNESKQVIGGVVFAHSPSRKELSPRIKQELSGVYRAVFYTGKARLRR
jgi:hypothetical protein